jgi:hypothetical protein
MIHKGQPYIFFTWGFFTTPLCFGVTVRWEITGIDPKDPTPTGSFPPGRLATELTLGTLCPAFFDSCVIVHQDGFFMLIKELGMLIQQYVGMPSDFKHKTHVIYFLKETGF